MNHRRERGETHKFRIELEQDMVHGRVAPNGYVLNVLSGETEVGFSLLRHLHPFFRPFLTLFLFLLFLGRVCVLDGLVDQPVEPFDNVVAHALEAIFRSHVKGDASHHVFAILALGVHEGDRIDDLHGGEIAEIPGHRGGPHIDGYSVRMFNLAGPDPDDLLVIPDTDGHLPVPVAQGRGKLP